MLQLSDGQMQGKQSCECTDRREGGNYFKEASNNERQYSWNIQQRRLTDNFVDTPGVHHSKNSLDKAMMKNVRSAIAGVDLVLYLIDGTTSPDDEEIDYIKHITCDKLVVRTKIDKPAQKTFESDIEISSMTGENLDKTR